MDLDHHAGRLAEIMTFLSINVTSREYHQKDNAALSMNPDSIAFRVKRKGIALRSLLLFEDLQLTIVQNL